MERVDAALAAEVVATNSGVEFVCAQRGFALQDLKITRGDSVHNASLTRTNRTVTDVTVVEIDRCFELY